MPEQPFDFQFNEFSKDTAPAGTPVGPTATPRPPRRARPAQPKARRAASDRRESACTSAAGAVASADRPAPSQKADAPKPQSAPTPAPAPQPTRRLAGGSARPSRPTCTPARSRRCRRPSRPCSMRSAAESDSRTAWRSSEPQPAKSTRWSSEGNLSEVWLPAMGTKTVALVLESACRLTSGGEARPGRLGSSSASSPRRGRSTATATSGTDQDGRGLSAHGAQSPT